jgi:hypothetical protein
MFRSYDHLQVEIYTWKLTMFSKNTPDCTTTLLISMYIFPPEDGHKTETYSGY